MGRKRKTIVVDDARFVNRLDLLCRKHYGYWNEALLSLIIALNPQIDWYAGFTVGEKLTLPHARDVYHA